MDYDLLFIIGLFVTALSIPAMLSAISHSMAPRAAAIAILVGLGCLVLAITQKPGGYSMAGIPVVFVSVVERYTN